MSRSDPSPNRITFYVLGGEGSECAQLNHVQRFGRGHILLWRPVRGGLVSKKDLELRFRSFQTGQWRQLLNTSASTTAKIHQRSVRRRRHQREETVERRAIRALSRVNLGELSAARQALEGASLAPGTHATLWALTDPERRLAMRRRGLSQGN